MAKEIEAECPKCYEIFDFNTDDFPEADSDSGISDMIQLTCPHCGESFTK